MEMISNTTWIACIHHYHYPKEIIFIQIWVTMDKSRDFSPSLLRQNVSKVPSAPKGKRSRIVCHAFAKD